MKSVKQLQKEGKEDAKREELEQYGNVSKLPLPSNPDVPRIDENTQQPVINARDAEVGKDYLTVGVYYKVTILKKFGDEHYVSSVQVQAEGSYKPLGIAGGTELIAFQEQFYKPRIIEVPEEKEETTTPKEKKSMATKEKASKTSAEPKLKMSSIILPMLAEAIHTAAEIADAVIKSFPDKKGDRDKLISQIEGPRLYNMLKTKAQWKGNKTPGVKEDATRAAAKIAKAAKKTEKKAATKAPVKKEKKAATKAPAKEEAPVPPAAV